MKNASRLLDILDRCLTGPSVDEQEFDRQVAKGIRRAVKEYDIRVDRTHVVNLDDALADRVWQAALDFLSGCGVYCQSTNRSIRYSRKEIEQILRDAPSEVLLGEGTDARLDRCRRVEDPRTPLIMGGPIGSPISEELFLPAMQSYVQEPRVDVVCAATPLTVEGREIRSRSPLEILAAWQEYDIMTLALRRVGRPGMAVCGPCISVSDVSFLSAVSRGGFRPTDMHTLGMLSELKVNFETLNKVTHVVRQGGIMDPFANPIYGGMGGGVEGIAVLMTAELVALNLVYMAVCHGTSPTHPFHFHDTGREIMQATSLSFQAVARNSHLMTNLTVSPVGGPGTSTLLYECVACTTMATVSGSSRILGPRSATGVVEGHFSGLETRFNAEVAEAATALSRDRADETVQRALACYEDLLDKQPYGKPFQEVYDLRTLQPTAEWLAVYEEVKQEVIGWGLSLD